MAAAMFSPVASVRLNVGSYSFPKPTYTSVIFKRPAFASSSSSRLPTSLNCRGSRLAPNVSRGLKMMMNVRPPSSSWGSSSPSSRRGWKRGCLEEAKEAMEGRGGETVVLVIGVGEREVAVCRELRALPWTKDMLCAPGSNKAERYATCIPELDFSNPDTLCDFCLQNNIGLVVLGRFYKLLLPHLQKVGVHVTLI